MADGTTASTLVRRTVSTQRDLPKQNGPLSVILPSPHSPILSLCSLSYRLMMRRLLYTLLLCGWSLHLASDCPTFYGYQFLDPTVVAFNSRLTPFYLAFGEVYQSDLEKNANLQRTDNVAEWFERYCEQVQAEDLDRLIYGDYVRELQRLLILLRQQDATSADLPSRLRSNSFAAHLVDYRCVEVIEYLLYAKRIEPYVVRTANAFESQAKRKTQLEELINEGLDDFKTLKSHYVRLRYAYQIIRMAHYLGEHAYVLELYDYLMPKIEANPSIIYDWIAGHRAGALQALGNYPESAYIFSRIFDRCPSKRESAYNSFRIRTDAEWQATSNLCANDHERAMLHVLRAQNGRAVVIEEMQNIYALEPQNAALAPLLMRELLELEKDLLGLDFNPNQRENKRTVNRPRPNAAKRLLALQAFVNEVVKNSDTANPELWLLARGVIEMLAGDYFYARRTFQELGAQTRNDSMEAQVDILTEVMNVLALNKVNDSVEVYYFDLLDDEDFQLQYPDIRALVNDKLEAVYYRTGRRGKAALMQYGFDALQKNPQRNTVTELEAMTDSLLGNDFDRRLIAYRIGEDAQADIDDLLGTYYLQQGQWETALEVFQRIPTARRDAYGTFYPFEKQFGDRVNFSPSATLPRFNKVDLLERLISLEDDARRSVNDTVATRNYFRIGLAHYNMSYYSYNWRMADYFRSSSSGARATRRYLPDGVFSHVHAPLGNRENFGMDRASYYFKRALTRAPSREAAAEILYYLAKTERNVHYALGRPGGARPFSYFRRLRDEYNDTKYYQLAVEECKTFAWFVGR